MWSLLQPSFLQPPLPRQRAWGAPPHFCSDAQRRSHALRQIQTEWEIPTIAQRLYYRGHELLDGSATLRALGVLSHDTMDLREEAEDIDLLGSGSDAEQPAARRAEGRAFGGTLLGYSSASSPPQTPPSQDVADGPGTAGISCPACTFDNAADAFSCAMCETMLGSVPD